MLNLLLVSLLTTASVRAQNSAAVPSGVSDDCKTFLNKLNADVSLAQCLDPILTATAAFNPTASFQLSTANVTKALEGACSPASFQACGTQDRVIRNKLKEFSTACRTDLQERNPAALAIYDGFYLLSPFRTAACTKDDSGAWCALKISKGTDDAEGSRGAIQAALQLAKTQLTLNSPNSPPKPNPSTFSQSSLPFLFLVPSLPSSELCVPCAKNILSAYASFESQTPYAIGIQQSPILGTQEAIWSAAQEKCNPEWFQDVVAKASSTGGNGPSGPAANAGDSPGIGSNGAVVVRANHVLALVAASIAIAAAF